jgi:hypothetical protein
MGCPESREGHKRGVMMTPQVETRRQVLASIIRDGNKWDIEEKRISNTIEGMPISSDVRRLMEKMSYDAKMKIRIGVDKSKTPVGRGHGFYSVYHGPTNECWAIKYGDWNPREEDLGTYISHEVGHCWSSKMMDMDHAVMMSYMLLKSIENCKDETDPFRFKACEYITGSNIRAIEESIAQEFSSAYERYVPGEYAIDSGITVSKFIDNPVEYENSVASRKGQFLYCFEHPEQCPSERNFGPLGLKKIVQQYLDNFREQKVTPEQSRREFEWLIGEAIKLLPIREKRATPINLRRAEQMIAENWRRTKKLEDVV